MDFEELVRSATTVAQDLGCRMSCFVSRVMGEGGLRCVDGGSSEKNGAQIRLEQLARSFLVRHA